MSIRACFHSTEYIFNDRFDAVDKAIVREGLNPDRPAVDPGGGVDGDGDEEESLTCLNLNSVWMISAD